MAKDVAARDVTTVIGVGASAGGVDALIRIVRTLPAELPAALCVVLHVPATGRSLLAPILDRQTALEASVPSDGEPLRPGRLYVAPPDRHLTVGAGRLALGRGPKENGVRPAVDPMLRSLASAYGEHSVAVILSGALGDGSLGAVAVKRAGGTVIVQDPEDATVPSMPESAIAAVGDVADVLTAEQIGPALQRLAGSAPPIREELVMAGGDEDRPAGPPSGFTCPECHGPLWETSEGDLVRYRCRVGHAYSEDSMMLEQGSCRRGRALVGSGGARGARRIPQPHGGAASRAPAAAAPSLRRRGRGRRRACPADPKRAGAAGRGAEGVRHAER